MLFPYLGLTKKKAWQAENPKGRSRQKLEQKKKKREKERVREPARLKPRKGDLGKN